MGSLDERIVAELRDISRFGFEQRWSRYWPLVFDAVENDPASVVDLRDAIIEIEERIARNENRPDLKRLLGDQRVLWQEEAEQVFVEFIEPFIHSDGSREEREALYNELQQVKRDVQQKIESTGRAQAFPEYVLALDYVCAFASVVTLAFTKTARRKPSPSKPPSERPIAAAAAPALAPAAKPLAPHTEAPGSGPPRPVAHEPARRQAKPPRRIRLGLVMTVLLLVLVVTGVGAAAYLRPDLLDMDKLLALTGGQSFDSRVDEFLARTASSCPMPDDDMNVEEILAHAPCIDGAKDEATTAFAALVAKADGTWSETGKADVWGVGNAERKVKLLLAWDHLVEIRDAYDDKVSQRILKYDNEFYPPDEERDALGWRFAVWLCACNERAEHVDPGVEGRVYRAFISGGELVTTPHTYQKLVTLLREYFLGGAKLGDPNLVAQTVEQFGLPHGLTAGPRLGGPFGSRAEAEKAIADVSALYQTLGFQITEVSLR